MISVIIPTYKPGEYIAHCIESIARQTLPKEQYEVIVVLNGCNEPYKSNILNILSNYSDLKVLFIQTDEVGVSIARNIALDNAKGEYISFVDDDDWVSENYLENLLNHTCDGITQSNLLMINEKTGCEMEHYVTKAYRKCMQYDNLNLLNARKFLSSVWSKLIPKDIIGDTRFCKDYTLGEDSLFMFAISRRIKKIQLAKEDAIYYVRCRQDSASRRSLTFSQRCITFWKLVKGFSIIYFGNMASYNAIFYLTRICATIKRYFIKR